MSLKYQIWSFIKVWIAQWLNILQLKCLRQNACGLNTYQIMYGEVLDSLYVRVSNGNLKCRIEKSIFVVNLPLKLFIATVANSDTGSLKSLHALFDKYLDHTLAKFELSCMTRKEKNELNYKGPIFYKSFFGRALTPFCKTFL